MPLVRMSLREGKSEVYCRATGKAVHRAIVEIINVPGSARRGPGFE